MRRFGDRTPHTFEVGYDSVDEPCRRCIVADAIAVRYAGNGRLHDRADETPEWEPLPWVISMQPPYRNLFRRLIDAAFRRDVYVIGLSLRTADTLGRKLVYAAGSVELLPFEPEADPWEL